MPQGFLYNPGSPAEQSSEIDEKLNEKESIKTEHSEERKSKSDNTYSIDQNDEQSVQQIEEPNVQTSGELSHLISSHQNLEKTMSEDTHQPILVNAQGVVQTPTAQQEAMQFVENAERMLSNQQVNQIEPEQKPVIEPQAIATSVQEAASNVEEYESSYFTSKSEKTVFLWFMLGPVLISLISTLHLFSFFSVGNGDFSSFMLSIAFEASYLSSILAIIALRGLTKATRFFLWSVIVLLFVLQFLGNVYASFELISKSTAMRMFEFFGLSGDIDSQRLVAYIIGGILPLVSFSLVKIGSDYLKKTVK
jgi:hypothetical protein